MSNGINPRLIEIITAVNDWCEDNGVQYDIACDESDIQGIKLFQKDRSGFLKLYEYIKPSLDKNKVHFEHERVRGGTILAFSLEALSESQLSMIAAGIGEEIQKMTFYDRITQAMENPIIGHTATTIEKPAKPNFEKSAIEIAEGSGYRPSRKEATPKRSTPAPKQTFRSKLMEALDGIATPTNNQPTDLFAKFARALRVLGTQMGIGPLQDVLKQQGINWKKSDDGQSIILFIVNAQTNAPQPISRISVETLENPGDFEEQLTNMLDFAKGEAPGASKQKQQEIRDQEKVVRDIAQSVVPKDDAVAQQMNGGQAAAVTAATPKV